MDIKEFVANIANVYDETDVTVFTTDTKFKELEEWSSLIALSIIAMVDDEYEVELKGDDIRNASTIADLYKLVKERNSNV